MAKSKLEQERVERVALAEMTATRWHVLLSLAGAIYQAEQTGQRDRAREFFGILLREARRDVEREERRKAREARESASKLKAVQ